MSERWKFQLKNGLIWGMVLSLSLSFFDLFEITFEDAFLSKRNLFRTLYFVVVGIFIVGYLIWKKKIKRDNTTKLPHNHTVNE